MNNFNKKETRKKEAMTYYKVSIQDPFQIYESVHVFWKIVKLTLSLKQS